MRKNLIILTLLVHLFSSILPAQSNYPIYVSPNLMPPYTLKLSDYSAMGSQKLMVTIVVNDLDVTNLPVKLRVKMETAGVTIENPPTITTIPIYLDGGSTTLLFGQDLIDNFNIDKLHFRGYSKKAYRSSGQIPEGFYRLTVEVLHFHTNKVISNQGTVSTWIAVGHPPQLQSPRNDSQLGQYIGMPITFSWLKSKVGSPIAAGNIQYKLELWEVRTPGVSPYTLAASMPVFHEFTTNSTFYSFDPASLMMEPGMTYAWRVTASDLGGLVSFEQDGKSEIRTFTYKALCETVTELNASASGKKGSFIWTPGGNHTSYNVEVRNPTANWFSASESFNSKVEFYDLTPGQTYEIRVQSVCNSDPSSASDFTQWKSLTIPVEKPMVNKEECPDCACEDELPHVTLKNFDLLQNLTPGDTLSNKTGTTRFILHSVEPQGDGSYKGIFYFWAEIWSVKVPCEFWDLQVNTDNVIVNMDYESVYDPSLFLDVDTITDLANNLLDNAAIITSDATIKDTMVIQQQYESIYVNHEGELIGVSVDAEGNVKEKELGINAEETDKTLIQNQDGEEVVVTRNGDVMGVEEYKNTGGGHNRMIRNHNKEKEENSLASSGMVDFSPSEAQEYGFDAYTDVKTNIQSKYPTLKNQYRPAFKSVASYKSDKVTVSNTDGLTFRDEMGLPAPVTNNQLTIRGSHNGNSRALYAYRKTNDEEEIAGKLNITSYDEQPKRVYIVPVNDADVPDKASLQTVLNSVYKQAITSWTVEAKNAIEVTFPSGTMTHGGSGLGTYNADQRTIVSKFTEVHGELEKEAYYLFFVKNVQDKGKAIAGYMPLQRQVGFIYGKPNNPTIAHELGHGAFNLRHPFSDNNFIATEGSTHNLMDYDSPKGSELWKGQWDLIHNPENVLFAWAQGEEEGASIVDKPGKVRAITELVRYAYACDRSIKIKSGTPSTNNITLGDEHEYGYIGIYIKEDATISNLKNSVQTDIPQRTWDGNEKKRIGFGSNSIEFITLTEDIGKIEDYLTSSQDKETYLNSIDELITGWETHYFSLNALPNGALKELRNEQRMKLIEKVIKSETRDIYPLINRVIANVPTEDIESFITILDQDSRIKDLSSMLNRAPFKSDDYDDFMAELFKLYYRQDPDAVKNLASMEDVFTWHKSREFDVLYNVSYTSNGSITFSGILDYLTEEGNERETIFDYQPSTTLRPMDIIGVNFTTSIDFLGVEDMVLPMPAIFYKWIIDKYNADQLRDMISGTISVASFCVAYGEAKAAIKLADKSIRLALSITGLIYASGDLFLEFNDYAKDELRNSLNGRRFLSFWYTAGVLFNGQTAIEKIGNQNFPLFVMLKFSWDGMTAMEKSLFSESERARINEIIELINSEINVN
jgi:hypothetical protein